MTDSEYVSRLNAVQSHLNGHLKPIGYKRYGRTYNRKSESGIIQVINLQMGQYPVGQNYELPPYRINLYGKFTVNLGIFIPEVPDYYLYKPRGKTLKDYDCHLRARLGDFMSPREDRWWSLDHDLDQITLELTENLLAYGLKFLDHFSTHETIINEWVYFADTYGLAPNARIVVAILHYHSGERSKALELLIEQYDNSHGIPAHQRFLETLAEKLGIGPLLR